MRVKYLTGALQKRSGYLLLILLGLLNLTLTACGADATATSVPATATPASTEIKVGVMVPLTGSAAVLGQDAVRGVQLALSEVNGQIGTKKVTIITKSPDGTGSAATGRATARELVEQSSVDFIIGPFGGDEGIGLRDYAKTRLDKAFINGTDPAQDTTLRDPAPNFFRFNPDGVQVTAGLGSYVYQTLGYKKVAVIAADLAGQYTRLAGFALDFCRAGGTITQRSWKTFGSTDFMAEINTIPADTEALYVDTGGKDGTLFVSQYAQSGKKLPLLGSPVFLDQSLLSQSKAYSNVLLGAVSSSSIADDNQDPAWTKYVQSYKAKFPDGLPSPTSQSYNYYLNTKAALQALNQVKGDLGNNQTAFKEALANLKLESPTGMITLDSNRQAKSGNFLLQVAQRPDGSLYNKLLKAQPAVSQTLDLPTEKYLKLGVFGRENPTCDSVKAAGF